MRRIPSLLTLSLALTLVARAPALGQNVRVNGVAQGTVTTPVSAGNGGTGQTTAPDDRILIANGTGFDLKALADCTGAGKAVTYSTSTNTLGCNTISGGASTLATLTDVTVTSPMDGEVLTYDSGTSKWINAGALGGAPPFTLAPSTALATDGVNTLIGTDANGNPRVSGGGGYFGWVTPSFFGVTDLTENYGLTLADSGLGLLQTVTIIGRSEAPGASGTSFFSNTFVNSGSPFWVTSLGAAASVTTVIGVPNADLTWTETIVGQTGNAIQVEYVDPGGDDQALSASYVEPLLTISLATDGAGVITTTAQDIIDLGSYDGAPLTVQTTPGNDGTGIVTAMSANLSGGLSALNVTGPSWLDSGAITTDGAGAANFGGSVTATDFIGVPRVPVTAIGSLPTCDGAAEGSIRGVNDALLPAALAIVAAGGSVHVPVYCDGTNWRVM